jgi:hypothetical protein
VTFDHSLNTDDADNADDAEQAPAASRRQGRHASDAPPTSEIALRERPEPGDRRRSLQTEQRKRWADAPRGAKRTVPAWDLAVGGQPRPIVDLSARSAGSTRSGSRNGFRDTGDIVTISPGVRPASSASSRRSRWLPRLSGLLVVAAVVVVLVVLA